MRKQSKNRIPTLKRKLWDAFRQFIYLRDGNTCITCGAYCEGQGRHAGHFIPDSISPPTLRYHEKNVHVQCYRCNIHLGGWGERYAQRMEEIYGSHVVAELRDMQKKLQGEKWGVKEFEAKINYYKQLCQII